jgi:flagellar hook-basal body complex protein FliE
MSIQGIKSAFESIKPIIQPKEAQGTGGGAKGEGFAEMLGDAIREVDNMQKTADKQVDSVVLGKDGVTSHEAMIALEKADVAFQLMNQVRSKIIRAYEEVMRTQV